MAVIVNGDGILTGVSSLTTALDDLTSGRGTVTGVATVGTLQLGAGVSISSPRTQNAAIFTNNTEFFTVDDAGRVGVGTVTPNSDAHPQNVGKINVGFITARSIAGDIDARNVVVAGVSTFVGAINGNVTGDISGGTVAGSTGTFSSSLNIADKIVHIGDTDTAIRFPSNDAFSVETAGSERFAIASNGNKNISNGHLTITSTYIDFAGSISTPGTAAAIYRPADNNLAFSTGNVERIRITGNNSANCKVGINTVNPQRVLSVYRSTTSVQDPAGNNSGGLIIHNAGGDAHDNKGFGKYAALELTVGHGANSVGNIGLVRTGNNIGDIFFSGRTGGSSYKEHMRITSDGKVGIGLTNPSIFNASADDLVIQGSGNTGITIDATSAHSSNIFFADGATGSEAYRGYCQYVHSSDTFILGRGGVDHMFLQSDGGTKNVLGNFIVGASGRGLQFNASDSGSSELLDDYEEGTWTPTGSWTTIVARYTKIGRMVYAGFSLRADASSGNVTIGGFPFASDNNHAASGGIAWGLCEFNSTGGWLNGSIGDGESTATIRKNSGAVLTFGSGQNNLNNSAFIRGVFIYNTA